MAVVCVCIQYAVVILIRFCDNSVTRGYGIDCVFDHEGDIAAHVYVKLTFIMNMLKIHICGVLTVKVFNLQIKKIKLFFVVSAAHAITVLL